MCVSFCHWLFVAFCSTVRRGRQVFELHISFNMKRWRRVICGRCRHKSTQTTLSQSICLTSSARHYWREREKKRKSIGQWPPWKSCSTHAVSTCAPLVLNIKVGRNRREYKGGWKARERPVLPLQVTTNILCNDLVLHSHVWLHVFRIAGNMTQK